ncbi:MAG: ExeM/NucH family extracellular endonuclease [Psychrobium sp.]|nr:ExeM/NucH family extracellular endonuclease [Psychrobium sp.]
MTNKLLLLLLAGLTTAHANASTSALPATSFSIMDIQGQGSSSPLLENNDSRQLVLVSGAITAIVTKELGKDLRTGFFMQDVTGDNNPLTSDGIFVSASSEMLGLHSLKIGDIVNVTGSVQETYGWTQIRATQLSPSGKHVNIAATIVEAHPKDKSFQQTLERFEGMLIEFTPQSNMLITRTFGYDRSARRNNMALAQGAVNSQANQYFAANSPQSKAQHLSNVQRLVVVESFNKANNGEIPWYQEFGQANENTTGSDNYLRIGDQVNSLTGVLAYSYDNFRLYVTKNVNASNFSHLNIRTITPPLKAGDVTVATFNVLNYFNSPFGGSANPQGQSRGANTKQEFSMQAKKIVAAIVALDADIIGLMEIENNGYGEKSALADLLSRVNEKFGTDKQYVMAQDKDIKFIGTGAITNQVIYRPSVASLQSLRIIDMPQQHAPKSGKESGNNYMRDAVTPTFLLKASGETLTVSVNHFKSKGSTCWEDVAQQKYKDVDRQGSCENFRVSGAFHLGQQLANVAGHTLIVGDLNSYGHEDPLLVLTNRDKVVQAHQILAARDTYIGGDANSGRLLHGNEGAKITTSFGYVNAVALKHPKAYGYSFKDVVGTLDYILASPSLLPHIVDATEWNINASESTLLEYGVKYTGDMAKYGNMYRSSDHDPVLISLTFPVQKKAVNSGGLGFIAAFLLLLAIFSAKNRQQKLANKMINHRL